MTHDLAYLVDRAMEDPRLHGRRPVVEKELLHYDILFALERGGFLDRLVFQVVVDHPGLRGNSSG